MLAVIRRLLEKTNNIKRSSYVWNAMNAIISALQSPVIMMVMTRTNGVDDAGVFSIAFAVATLMLYVGLYGLRRFQSSDMHNKYTFGEYHGMRILTCSMMLFVSLMYCFYGLCFTNYTSEKATVIFLICIAKCCQAYSDVYHGCMQQKGRLDVATKSSSVRYLAEMVLYAVALVITKNLIISTAVFTAASIFFLLITSVNAGKNYCYYKPEFNWKKIRMLAIEGFPLFISLFLNMYISNAPKYAIDQYLNDEVQAIYNMIFMPAFMVMMISNFIFNPILTTYAELWLAKTKEALASLKKHIAGQMMVVLGLTILGLIVAYTIAIPLLSLIFGVDLSSYKMELCVVMIGGGVLAYCTFFSTVLTVIRLQQSLMVCYVIVSLAAKLLSKVFVTNLGIMGAASMYAALMILLALMLGAITLWRIRKEGKLLNKK
ncbi:MAG: oligosaccharide flippase family protein [Firmicutes bacterium]|nr:oligosaccharide flippase family protein [Bacillota bacterium]